MQPPASRVTQYSECLNRFNRWIENNLQADGSWAQPCSSGGYFSALAYAQHVGRHDWVEMLLRQLRQRHFDSNGRLVQPEPRLKTMAAYVPAWLAWKTFECGAFDLYQKLIAEVVSHQDPSTGACFGDLQTRDAGAGLISFDTTCMAAVSCALTGRKEYAVQAADFLLRLHQSQPDPERSLCLDWDTTRGLALPDASGSDCNELIWDQPRQHYYKIGLYVVGLISAYAVTGREAYLESATCIYALTARFACDLWGNALSHKMAWAATMLHTITGDHAYLEDACQMCDHLVKLQLPEGCFGYPEYWGGEGRPPTWEGYPNIGCQFAWWIARTRDRLLAGA